MNNSGTEVSRSAVAKSPLSMEIRSINVPRPAALEGLLKVEVTGVCTSDWNFYEGIRGNLQFPLILGHEVVGRLVAAGEGAAERWNLKIGDRLLVEEFIPCYLCERCIEGRFNLCSRMTRYGGIPLSVTPSLWGGYSQFMYLHRNSLIHRLPEGIPLNIAPMFIPLANGLNWVGREGGLTLGETVVVQGVGQQGLASIIAAREMGARRIIVVGLSTDAQRFELSKRLGADFIVVANNEDPVARVSEITSGEMADLVIDATSGSPEAFKNSIRMARKGGRIVLSGFRKKKVDSLDVDEIISKALTIKGVLGREPPDINAAISKFSDGKVPLQLLSTHEFSLDETDLAIRTAVRQVASEVDPIHVSVYPWEDILNRRDS